MPRPRKLSELQLHLIRKQLAMLPLKYYVRAIQNIAQAYKISLRTLRRRLHLERRNKYGRKTNREKHHELAILRSKRDQN